MASVRTPMSKQLRFSVFERDVFTCQYCGKTPPTVILNVDHILPVSKGGTDDPENLRTACSECNSGKAARKIRTGAINKIDALRRMQEAAEDVLISKEFSSAVKARESLRQQAATLICGLTLNNECQKASVTSLITIIREVGADRAIEWLDIAASRTLGQGYNSPFRETGMIKYLCAVARNHRNGEA